MLSPSLLVSSSYNFYDFGLGGMRFLWFIGWRRQEKAKFWILFF